MTPSACSDQKRMCFIPYPSMISVNRVADLSNPPLSETVAPSGLALFSTTMLLPPRLQPPSGELDLLLLTPLARVFALVIRPQQQDQLVAVGVAEHAQKDWPGRRVTEPLQQVRAVRVQDLRRVVPQPELEEAIA